jgi:chemotaxis protein MotA
MGIAVAATGVAIGLFLDGGKITQILQPTAALIVFGGTLGAVMVQFPMRVLRESAARLHRVLFEPERFSQSFVNELMEYALKARRKGVVSLDSDLGLIEDPFLRKCLTGAVDGMRSHELREMMEIDLACEEQKDESMARIFEAAGGFAPTIGIIGAVLGLIQVMQKLDNIGEVGKGIAVAFVATLYGVGSANLLFLPLAGKVRIRLREQQMLREIILDAALAITDGISPSALRQKLNTFVEGKPTPVSAAEMATR